MTLLVVGVSHRSAPVSLLERVALAPEARVALLRDMVGREPIQSAAVLSTCNRIELYADVTGFHAGLAELSALLSRHGGVSREELSPHLYVHYDDRAVHHLFTVGCGLDSMVVGEGQILGQIKEALALAQDEQTAGRLLNELFQQTLRVGKRAHSETGIDRAGQSLVTFGLTQLADGGQDPAGTPEVERWLAGKRALVIGAGSMSSLAAAVLARAGVSELVIANRTLERAERLAVSLDGRHAGREGGLPRARAVPINAISIAAELALADVVVSCTGAAGLVLTAEAVAGALTERSALARTRARADGASASTTTRAGSAQVRPLAVLDLAMPRDVDAGVHRLDGVRLVDIESLAEASVDAPMAADVDAVTRIVAEEVAAFEAAQQAAQIAPTVVALRSMAADVVASELARLHGRLPGLDDKERTEITRTVRRVVDKLLHAPTVRVKELAGEPGGADYAAALRELFALDAPPQPQPAGAMEQERS
ncbi:glutamyl-tRNA reductase [Streptomyces sp. 4N509B]|uniref:glutamyl-tRNA reductase n=1 Tax=Streptomyces sp. 4N509B TaxID=3457413 RepID=UPI003FD4D43B